MGSKAKREVDQDVNIEGQKKLNGVEGAGERERQRSKRNGMQRGLGLTRLNEPLARSEADVSTGSALKITKRVLRGTKVGNRRAAPVECLSRLSPPERRARQVASFPLLSRPSLCPSGRGPVSTFLAVLPSSVFFSRLRRPSSPPSSCSRLARRCDLKRKLKYSSR